MRRSFRFLIVTAVAAAAAWPPPAPAQRDVAEPRVRSFTERADSSCERTRAGYRCILGPVTIPKRSHVRLATGAAAPPEPGYFTSLRSALVDADGRKIAHHLAHIHHAVWFNPMSRDLTCDVFDRAFPDYERFFVAGEEATPVRLPDGFGYRWERWSESAPGPLRAVHPFWMVNSELMGMHGVEGAFIRLDLGFEPLSAELQPIEPLSTGYQTCSSRPVYDIPKSRAKGRLHTEEWRQVVPQRGRIVYIWGHLHEGGVSISVYRNRSRKPVAVLDAVYRSRRSKLARISAFAAPRGVLVERGDALTVRATYDRTERWDDVMMGIVAAIVPAARGR